MIRLHPNGFIQYDLPEARRLHIWAPDLPEAQVVRTLIHDHTFDFESEVICGELRHQIYWWKQTGLHAASYRLHEAIPSGGLDTELVPIPYEMGEMILFEEHKFSTGWKYQFHHGLFHESSGHGMTATIMTKTATGFGKYARIAVPLDSKPDNDFKRHQYSEEELMPYVEKVRDITGLAL